MWAAFGHVLAISAIFAPISNNLGQVRPHLGRAEGGSQLQEARSPCRHARRHRRIPPPARLGRRMRRRAVERHSGFPNKSARHLRCCSFCGGGLQPGAEGPAVVLHPGVEAFSRTLSHACETRLAAASVCRGSSVARSDAADSVETSNVGLAAEIGAGHTQEIVHMRATR